MRTVAATLVGIALGVGATFGALSWREREADASERDRVEAYAEAIVASGEYDSVDRLRRETDGLWLVAFEDKGRRVCFLFDLDRYVEVEGVSRRFPATTKTRCPEPPRR